MTEPLDPQSDDGQVDGTIPDVVAIEEFRDARDLLLLSATPHQGDHFRFWMLIQLLNPTLFNK